MLIYIKTVANWIWGGCLLMAVGSLLALTESRYRVVVGARRKPKVTGVAAE